MNDGPSSNSTGLKEEWSLLVHSFLDQPDDQNFNPKDLTFEQIKEITRGLSQQRKTLNQRIESIKAQIDELHATLETLELVGGDTSETQTEIETLTNEGETVSTQIFGLEKKLNKIHELKDKMQEMEEQP